EEADLEGEPRVMPLEALVCDEGEREDQEERPAHSEGRAAEIIDEERAPDAAEEELHHVHEPEVERGVFGAFGRGRCGAGGLTRLGSAPLKYGPPDERARDENDVPPPPHVLQKEAPPRKRPRVKHDPANERYRRNRPLPPLVPAMEC